MWTIVASNIVLVMTFADITLAEGNGTALFTLDQRFSKFKADVHHILQGSRIRMKRQLEGSDPLTHKFKFGKVTPVDLPYLSDISLSFWLSIETRNQILIGTTDKRLILFEMLDEDRNAQTVALTEAEISFKARAFSYYDEQWFVVLHNSGSKFYLQLYQLVGRSLEKRQTIDLTGFSDMELVSTKGMHYLVLTTYSTTTTQGFSYQTSVTLYYWAQTQFDAIASRKAYGARSLACWISEGSLYIAVGQEIDDQGNMDVGSAIYLYNSKEENKLVLWEMLSTYGPSKVQHFYVAENHYLVFIGRRDAVIYWWSSGQFLEWQTLTGTAHALDVSVLSLGDEVAVVIVLKENALFYTLDDSGHYVISFTMSFEVSTLLSLQFMFSGATYYALALFAGSRSQSIWRLELEYHSLPSVDSLDSLQQFLLDTKEKVAERQVELNTIKEEMKRIWRRRSNQTIISKVIVKGRILSKEPKVRNVIILSYTNIPYTPFSLVVALITKLLDSMKQAENELNGVVLKSTRQNIKGIKHFADHVYIPSLRIESTINDVSINGVRISRLQNYALRKKGNQIISKASVIANVYAGKVNVVAINGISTDDLLLLHGRQVVTGSLIFSVLSASSFTVDAINSIPVEDIVTTTTSQTIKDFKTFSLLKSYVINVQREINGVDLEAIYDKIATVDAYNKIIGHLEFQKPLTVNNIFLTSKLNNEVDISRLVSQSVHRDSQQDLTGFYSFKSNQILHGDLLVTDSINGVSVDNLLTLGSSQKIYADIVFAEPLIVARDVVVGTVNGINLEEQALKKSLTRQFISGPKIFQKDITADFVDMSDYVTLDGVDPSFLVQSIIQHNQGVVNHTFISFNDVHVLGNVTALNGINDRNVQDLLSSVWLKSVEQTITTPVKTEHVHFEYDVEANTVNNFVLDNDFVTSYKDDTIESSKSFRSKTILMSLKTAGDVTINGIHPKSLKTELDNYVNEWTIRGTKFLDSFEVFGNLTITKLNGLGMSEIMSPYAAQTVYGPVEFPAEITSVIGDVQSKSVSFGVFNGLNLQEYFRRAVASTHPMSLTDKYFQHIKASNLLIPPGGELAGVSLEMRHRVVTLNSPQLITAPKSFLSEVNFSKVITAAKVNGLLLSNYLSKIVQTDETSKISHKNFIEDVQTTYAFVGGKVNGVNVQELAENAFYKSTNNEIEKHLTFKDDIDVGDLSASIIAGVHWKDLILLQNDEVLETGWFLSNIIADKDVFITGLLNGCDLSRVSSSVYTNKTDQVVNKRINVHTIQVVGNLKVKKLINKIPFDILQNFITKSEDQIITSDVVIEGGANVDNMVLLGLVNSANIGFIMTDAVRHSLRQEITGPKEFEESTTVTHLTGGDLFVSRLNGIDLAELEETSVSKTGYQEIEGDKIFSYLQTNVATIDGFLNGLLIPQDVIRVDVSEHITYPTYFMSDLYVPTEIVVHGLIDGVNLNELIKHRVTLSTRQNISAQMFFQEDAAVQGELTIDGTVNEIVLDLVAKVKSTYPVQGYKVFVEFYVAGSVSTSLINGLDLSQLDANILKYNKDDYINEIQRFDKTLLAQNSLYAEWINDVSIKWLKDSFVSMMNGLMPVLGYLENLSSSLQQQLTRQLSVAQDRVSKFTYFALHQEIDTGPTSRILYGYDIIDDTFSHSLVMWTKQKHCIFMEKCCQKEFSYWLRVMRNGIIMVDKTPEPGKYYPISNPSPVGKSKDFFVWTNSTDKQPKSCGDTNERIILASYTSENFLEVFLDLSETPQLSDIKSFRKGRLYAVAGFYYDSKQEEYGSSIVYVYDEMGHWSEHEVLPSFGVLSLDIISYTKDNKEDILLAMGTGMDIIPTSYSTVYKWNDKNRSFEVVQNIPSRYVTSTVWIKGRDLLLSLASVEVWPNKATECSELVSGGQIDIYLYKDKLNWIQRIPIGGIVSMVSFSSDGDTYLAAASSQQNVHIFEWKGYSGFVEIQLIAANAQHLSIYNIDEDIYMTMASPTGPSKILKMVKKGRTSSKFYQISLEQKDEVPPDSNIISGC